jgi:hypothetical protein
MLSRQIAQDRNLNGGRRSRLAERYHIPCAHEESTHTIDPQYEPVASTGAISQPTDAQPIAGIVGRRYVRRLRHSDAQPPHCLVPSLLDFATLGSQLQKRVGDSQYLRPILLRQGALQFATSSRRFFVTRFQQLDPRFQRLVVRQVIASSPHRLERTRKVTDGSQPITPNPACGRFVQPSELRRISSPIPQIIRQ